MAPCKGCGGEDVAVVAGGDVACADSEAVGGAVSVGG